MNKKITEEQERQIIEYRLMGYNLSIIESLVKVSRNGIQHVLDRNGIHIEYQSRRNLRKDEIYVAISRDERIRLDERASKEGKPHSAIIKEAISKYLNGSE